MSSSLLSALLSIWAWRSTGEVWGSVFRFWGACTSAVGVEGKKADMSRIEGPVMENQMDKLMEMTWTLGSCV